MAVLNNDDQPRVKISRKNVHSKTKTSNNVSSKLYVKKYKGQGR